MSVAVRKAVIPMAGRGTRFRPITHVVPKEFLPIINKPLVHYALEEIIHSGGTEAICVVAPGDDMVQRYAQAVGLEIKITVCVQDRPGGLGHAVACAERAVGDESFFVLLPDVLIDAPIPVSQQLRAAQVQHDGAGILATRSEPEDKLAGYGVIAPGAPAGPLTTIHDLVEKPAPGTAPSSLTIVGRYLLPPSLFRALRDTKPGALGEIQLTDALRHLLRHERLYALAYEETAMFDTGHPAGWLAANRYYGAKAGL